MLDILLKAFGFVVIIILGYILKSKGVFQKEHAKFLSVIIMNITLPCSLLASVNQIEISHILILALLMGLCANIGYNFLGYFVGRKQSLLNRALYMINLSGYNIGTFALPFIQSFFSANALAYVVMFDTGNAIMCLGGTYSLASTIADSGSRPSIQDFLKKLFTSIPFCTYVLLFGMSLFHVSLPIQLIEMASIAGNANAFLAMLMIGISLEIKLDMNSKTMIRNILVLRYVFAAVFSIFVYFLLPADVSVKQMIILCLFSPISSVAPAYSLKLGSDSPVPAAVNSIGMIISICVMTGLLLFFAI